MPADEGFYRDQGRLHVVFFVSSALLLVCTIWMLAADHLQPWKQYQREFNSVIKREKLQDDLSQETIALRAREAEIASLENELAAAAATADSDEHVRVTEGLKASIAELKTNLVPQDFAVQSAKADRQAALSAFDLIVKELETVDEQVERRRHQRLATRRDAAYVEYLALEKNVAAAQAVLDATKLSIRQQQNELEDRDAVRKQLAEKLAKAKEKKEKLERSSKAAVFTAGASFRGLPILDALAAPVKADQVVLDDLKLNYNFKYVTRHDRCRSCHAGIDQAGYSADMGVKHPFRSHPHLDLFLSSDSPHPVEKFGCTICHQGQGSATSFDWASHTPNDARQLQQWKDDHGWFFNHFHELPMFPKRFAESGCIQCHHDPHQFAIAEEKYGYPIGRKALLGYETVRTYGCFGCHEILGYAEDGSSIGPNLRLPQRNDAPELRAKSMRRVGPSLMNVREKLSEDFVRKWIRDPQAFRPTTRMPSFYDQLDHEIFGDGPDGEFEQKHDFASLAAVEIQAITHFLFALSEPTPDYEPVSATGNKENGKRLFVEKGCLACHYHKEHPEGFTRQQPPFAPDLSEIGAKFTTDAQKRWVAAWIKNPAAFNKDTYMPDTQLSDQEIADIAAYLLSVPGKWQKDVTLPELDRQALRDLALLYESKSASRKVATETIENPDKLRERLGSFIDLPGTVEPAAEGQKIDTNNLEPLQLLYLGYKSVSRMGCFGCHAIPGRKYDRDKKGQLKKGGDGKPTFELVFDVIKPIGTTLNNWGRKDTHQLAFENVVEYVHHKMEAYHDNSLPPAERDFYEFYADNDHYLWSMHHHQREGFLMQKLREPRSYDYKKIRRWDDRARMPRFNLTDAERDAVATFILGLFAEKIPRQYIYAPDARTQAQVDGHRFLNAYNCVACHVTKPGEYQAMLSDERAEQLMATAKSSLDNDFPFTGHIAWDPRKSNTSNRLIARGLPAGKFTDADAGTTQVRVQLWEATSIKGQAVPAGTSVLLSDDARSPAESAKPKGGKFAFELTEYLLSKSSSPESPDERDKAWQKAPPPLIREGEKVQTQWLYRFLKDPVSVRPGVVLRMPKFNFAPGHAEAIADYFAAADGVAYPYSDLAERQASYLDQKGRQFNFQGQDKGLEYLQTALRLVTHKDLCVKCHPIAGNVPTGKDEEKGPDLARAHERLRPDWLARWITNPKRLLPYTQMPVNFQKSGEGMTAEILAILKTTEQADRIRAVRDVLLNYPRIAEDLIPRPQVATNSKLEGSSP